jgi:lipoprotein-anchoring transpeptidase ErfK/SrfK
MAGLEPTGRDAAAQARPAALHEGWPRQSPRRRALYLGSSMSRIHGSSEPETIGYAVSSGSIRMTNAYVADLYNRTKVGTKVVVLR